MEIKSCTSLIGLRLDIDHIDYVNGIGNRSREQYVYINDGCALRVIVEVDGFIEFYVRWY